jgi:hypothetical protein
MVKLKNQVVAFVNFWKSEVICKENIQVKALQSLLLIIMRKEILVALAKDLVGERMGGRAGGPPLFRWSVKWKRGHLG